MAKKACPKCAAAYEVTMRKAPVPDEDHFNCEVCGHRMDTWKSNTYPEYQYIEGTGKRPDK